MWSGNREILSRFTGVSCSSLPQNFPVNSCLPLLSLTNNFSQKWFPNRQMIEKVSQLMTLQETVLIPAHKNVLKLNSTHSMRGKYFGGIFGIVSNMCFEYPFCGWFKHKIPSKSYQNNLGGLLQLWDHSVRHLSSKLFDKNRLQTLWSDVWSTAKQHPVWICSVQNFPLHQFRRASNALRCFASLVWRETPIANWQHRPMILTSIATGSAFCRFTLSRFAIVRKISRAKFFFFFFFLRESFAFPFRLDWGGDDSNDSK